MLLHHSAKSMKADAIDGPLGSTAIGGAVCTLLVLHRAESHRTIQTVQGHARDSLNNTIPPHTSYHLGMPGPMPTANVAKPASSNT